jgi:signal transduction histidine kinase
MNFMISHHSLPPLRNKLLTPYLIIVGSALSLLGLIFAAITWSSLHAQIDHHIHLVVTQAQQIVNNFNSEQEDFLLESLVQMEGMSVLVIGSDGKIVIQKHSFDVAPFTNTQINALIDASAKIGYHPRHFTIYGQRFGSASVVVDNQASLLIVGASVAILERTFDWIIWLTILMVGLFSIAIFYLLSKLLKKNLAPLETVAQTAKEINEPQTLGLRTPQLAQSQEVAAIENSFNQMLARLEKVFKSERDFFAATAHALKTPLAVLRAQVETLPKVPTAKKQAMIKVIAETNDTIQDLLLVSQVETGLTHRRQKVNLHYIVRELAELASSLVTPKGIRLIAQLHPVPPLFANESLLKKALGNVVFNAIEYVAENGEITIKLYHEEQKIIFSVTNTLARPLSKNDLHHLWDRFYRGHNATSNRHGSGLGLTITKAIMDAYHAHAHAHADTQKFHLTLTFKNLDLKNHVL